MPDAEKLAAVRDALPAVGAGIYLNTPIAGPIPAETARAMADIANWELATGRTHRDRGADVAVRMDEARAGLAAVLGTDVGAIALTHGLGDGVRRAMEAIDWRAGDTSIFVDDAGSALSPVAVRPRVDGTDLIHVELPAEPDGSDDVGLVSAVASVLRPGTRLVTCPHVSRTGRLLPVERLASIAHDVGAVVLVDGSQAAGTIPVGFDELGADLYLVAGWTWLLGPEGIGALAAAGDLRDRLGILGERRPAQSGDFHVPSVVGLARSCGWLSMYVGLDWIFRRSADLAATVRARLRDIPGVTLLTPEHRSATTIAFRIAGWAADQALEELGSRAFALASVVPHVDAVRIGTGFFNTDDELDRFATAVELLATHTPDTLPPRRQLTIIGGDR